MVKLPITKEEKADIIVVGGGTAGCFAAIAAAQEGNSVILIEKNGGLGGTMVTANVNFPGLFFAWGKQVIAGLGWQAIKRTEELGGAVLPKISYRPQRHWQEQILCNRFTYSVVLDEFCEKVGVEVRLHTMLACAEEKNESVQAVFCGKEGLSLICAKVIIDATGDADVVRHLGYPCMKSEPLQPATLQNALGGYRIEEVECELILHEAERAIAAGKISHELTPEKVYSFLAEQRIDLHTPCNLEDTSKGRTATEQNARKRTMQILNFFRQLPGLENLQVVFAAEECGIRETNRIIGEHIVTKEEYLAGYTYPDGICHAFYPIDLHVPTGIQKEFLKEGVVPSIPYRALIPKNTRRVLAAGRIVSSDTEANSALRVQAPCMAMGQAAGCAAALAVQKECDVASVPYQALKELLLKQGAIVPEI